MKKLRLWILCTAVISVLLLSGCAASGTGGPGTTPGAAERKPRESTALETEPPRDTQNTEAPVTEPEQAEPADTSRPTESPEKPENCVHVQWAEDVLTDLSDYEQSILGLHEEPPLVYFSTDSRVEDFKVLSLTFESVDDDGTVLFAVEEILYHGTMTPEEPLLVRMELLGTIPNNGISYVDSSGETRYFAVEVSGYDGSLLLTEFTPKE